RSHSSRPGAAGCGIGGRHGPLRRVRRAADGGRAALLPARVLGLSGALDRPGPPRSRPARTPRAARPPPPPPGLAARHADEVGGYALTLSVLRPPPERPLSAVYANASALLLTFDYLFALDAVRATLSDRARAPA